MDAGPLLTPSIVAHRAWHQDGAPKNSMAALEAAARNGVDSVEMDIRRLGDGKLVIHHDAHRNGTPLSKMTLGMFPTDGTVPTLEEWARRAGELDIRVVAELKEAGYEQEVVDTLRRHVAHDRIDYISFKDDAVAKLAQIVPDRPRGFLSDLGGSSRPPAGMDRITDAIARATRAGASFIGINHRQGHEAAIAAIRGAGFDLAVWPDTPVPETVDDILRFVHDRRVTTYITDAPQLAMAARAGGPFGAEAGDAAIKLLRAAATMR